MAAAAAAVAVSRPHARGGEPGDGSPSRARSWVVPTRVGVNRPSGELVTAFLRVVPTRVGVDRAAETATSLLGPVVPTRVGVNRPSTMP